MATEVHHNIQITMQRVTKTIPEFDKNRSTHSVPLEPRREDVIEVLRLNLSEEGVGDEGMARLINQAIRHLKLHDTTETSNG